MVSITSKSLRVVAEAMAIADEKEGAISSFSSKPAEIKQGTSDVLLLDDMFSLEDIAWADSCLIKDPDISQIDCNSWNSIRDALIETLSYETDSPASRVENCPEVALTQISPSSQHIGTSEILGTRIDGDSSITEGADNNSEDQLINEHADTFMSDINLENFVLPTYDENLKNFGIPDTEEDVNFPGFVMEQPAGDIFKVWDLGLPTEDEFINQLNKALAQSSLEPPPSVFDDSGLLKGFKDIAIDDIISGMSDLSLNRFNM